MDNPITIDDLLATSAHDDQLMADAMTQIFRDLFDEDPGAAALAADTADDAITATVQDTTGLHMRPGGWVLDLKQSAARAAVAAAVIGGLLAPGGFDQLPGYVLPSVIPLLFDLKQAGLTRRDRDLLLELRLSQTTAQMTRPWPAGALYSRLPAHVQARVSPADFADFLDAVVQAGDADRKKFDEVVIRPAGDSAWLRLSLAPGRRNDP